MEGEQMEVAEPSEDGYWPALEILGEKKRDYLVNWDGIDPETGEAWAPSWTRKTEVTEDLIEAWETKKATKKKNNRRAPKTPKRSRVPATPTLSKPANRNSGGSRTSLMSNSRTTDSPVISLIYDDNSRIAEEPSLGKRKRRNAKHTPVNEDITPMSKKQRVGGVLSASQKPSTESSKGLKRIREEKIPEGGEDPVEAGNIHRSPSTSKAGTGGAVLRIGPPRKRKNVTPPSSRVPDSEFRRSRKEEESTQDAVGRVSSLNSNPLTVKKKRRLKPASDVRPKLPVLTEKGPLAPPSRNATQELAEPRDQEEPFEADLRPPDDGGDPTEPLPELTPPRTTRQQIPPDTLVEDSFSTPTPPRVMNNAKKLAPIPRLEPSHFKPYLGAADITSTIDEFSPKKSFPSQDIIEPSVQDSQVCRAVMQPLSESIDPAPVNDHLDENIAQKMQDVEDAYFDLDGQANGFETPNEEQPTTDPGSAEQKPPWSQSPVESVNAPVPLQSSNSQKLEDALVILNQKSEEIEVLESRLAAQEAQIEHLQVENYRIHVEYEKLSVAQEVQREVLEDAKGNVSELGVHIEWVQGLLDKSEAKVKGLQGEIDEFRDALGTKAEEHNLARTEWEHEKAALEGKLASHGQVLSRQTPADWELEKKELEKKVAELVMERDQLDSYKRSAENEIETWKEQYRKEFIHSQGLREEAKDAKAESSRVRGENAILASQTKEAIRLVTARYEVAVEMLKKELAKAEALYKVLRAKDEQTGDDLRKRAASATILQFEVRRLQEELAAELTEKATRPDEHEHVEYACQILGDKTRCDQVFDSPQKLWTHVLDGHPQSRGYQ